MTTDKQTVEVGQQAMIDERKESGLVERLRPFLRHTNLCAYKRFADRDNVCRCGLEEAVGEIAALIARDTEIERLREVLRRLVELDSDGEAGCAVDPIEYGEALNAARALNRQETDNA